MKQQLPSFILFLATAALAIVTVDGRGLRLSRADGKASAVPSTEALLDVDKSHVQRVTEAWQAPGFPDIVAFMKSVQTSLQPFEREYLQGRGEWLKEVDKAKACGYEDGRLGFLGGCPERGCDAFSSLEEAQQACDASLESCGGVTKTGNGVFEVRGLSSIEVSPSGETSYLRKACAHEATKTAQNVYSAFYQAVEQGMANTSLNLLKKLGPPRGDDSIFLSVASYRDTSCGPTLRRAFERAKHPEKLFVGIVQMNCERQCMTGTGWGETRRWIPSGPDPDCAMEFCTSRFGKPICDAGHVRMVRLEEKDALGPYFSRFLNSRLYRAETYFMQIDSHTNFRQDWDATMVSQIKQTPNYPRAIISNYPPDGTAEDTHVWPAFDSSEQENSPGLCEATFEGTGSATAVRFERTDAEEPKGNALSPPFSCFIAAGFLFGGAQLVDEVPFDPYMPWIFMGEELAFTIRFWTNGFDIHRPAADVVRHEYVRSEHPKFWESVNMIFSDPGMHNDLTSYILPRLHHLLGSVHAPGQGGIRLASTSSSTVDPAWAPLGHYGVGSNRSRQAFFSLVGFDFDKHVSEVPDWYSQSRPPPEQLRVLNSVSA